MPSYDIFTLLGWLPTLSLILCIPLVIVLILAIVEHNKDF